MTTTEYKQALREEFVLMGGAVAAEDWERVAVCAQKIDEYARRLAFMEKGLVIGHTTIDPTRE